MKRRIAALIMALCMVLSLAPLNAHATDIDSSSETVTLTITQPSEGGTITADRTSVLLGEIITVTATPYDGYHFVSWTGAFSDSVPTLMIEMHSGSSISAIFAPHSYGEWEAVGSFDVHKRWCESCRNEQQEAHAYENGVCTVCAMTIPTYTVLYTDGVADEVIFEDQRHNVLAGSDLPRFDLGTASLQRVGYTFGGWSPALVLTVNSNMTYTALWTPCSHIYDDDSDAVCNACSYIRTVAHIHTWGDWLSNGNDTHTRVCQTDASHIETKDCYGGEATCTQRARCTVCAADYGAIDGDNHAGHDEAWSYDDETHMLKCLGCDNAKDSATIGDHVYASDTAVECETCGYIRTLHTHSYSAATCTTPATCSCGETTGSVDKTNHVGGTEIRGAKEAAEFEDGYTGDTYCKGCGDTLANGQVIPATHVHSYDGIDFDDDNHWRVCACTAIAEVKAHNWYVYDKDATVHYWRCNCGNSGWSEKHYDYNDTDLCDDCGVSLLDTYTITYNPNGGEGFMSAQTFTEGAEQGLHENGFTREGCEFIGWTDGSNVYSDGESIIAVADTEMSALWHQHNYSNVVSLNRYMHLWECIAEGCPTSVLVENHVDLTAFTPCSVCNYTEELYIDVQFHDSTMLSLMTSIPADQVVADDERVKITGEGDSRQSWMAENLDLDGSYTFTATAGDQTASVTVDMASRSYSFTVATPDGEAVNVLVTEPEGEIIDGTAVDTVTEEEITELLSLAEAQDSDLILMNYSPLEAPNGASVLISSEAADAVTLNLRPGARWMIAASSAMVMPFPGGKYPVIGDNTVREVKIDITHTGNSRGAEISAGGETLYSATVTTENLEEDSQVTLILYPDPQMNNEDDQSWQGWTEGVVAYCANLGIVSGYNSDSQKPWEPNAISAVDCARLILLVVGYDPNQKLYLGVPYEEIDLLPGLYSMDDGGEIPTVKLRLSSKFIQDHVINDTFKGYNSPDHGILDYAAIGNLLSTSEMLEWFRERMTAGSDYDPPERKELLKELLESLNGLPTSEEGGLYKELLESLYGLPTSEEGGLYKELIDGFWEQELERWNERENIKVENTFDGIQFTISFENRSENDSDPADDRLMYFGNFGYEADSSTIVRQGWYWTREGRWNYDYR